MSSECLPIGVLPHISKLYGDYLVMGGDSETLLRDWYGAEPFSDGWMGRDVAVMEPGKLADLLRQKNEEFGGGPRVLENIERLRNGARAVITGQQVGLLGGPLLTLLKAATAIARAAEAEARTGVPHVPVFWLASEDHDLAEVDHVLLPGKKELVDLSLSLGGNSGEVGRITLGAGIEALLDQASELLGYAPVCDLLRECYTPETTLAGAFGRWMTQLYRDYGLIVVDAAGREFHALGAKVLRLAIENAAQLEEDVLFRSEELERNGYHSQVLVRPGGSLLFLIDESGQRLPLRRSADDLWKAGTQTYATSDLLEILERSPERISPNALLRPVFQDAIFPTAAYIGGPAEIAYFAQSAVLFTAMLGRLTPVLPRLSATIIPSEIGKVMKRHEVSVQDLIETKTSAELSQRLGARAMPIEEKRRISAVGNALDEELTAMLAYLNSLNAELGRSASVSASKMRYQMNRLRRMAARFEVQREESLGKHAEAMMLQLFPNAHPQERVIGGAWFLGLVGLGLITRLVQESADVGPGHAVIWCDMPDDDHS